MKSVGRTMKYLSRKKSTQLKVSQTKFDEFDICYGAANKVVKQDFKNGKDLDNICSKQVLRKDTNLFAKMQITKIKTFRTIKTYPPLTF